MKPDLSLYVIVDPVAANGKDLAKIASDAAKGGASILQYRDKSASTAEMIANARAIKAALSGTSVPLIINDRVDVALASQADGVHLGQSDMAPNDARALMGQTALIGRTIKTDSHAEALALELVTYACIGGVFATSTKHNAEPPLGLEGFRKIRKLIFQQNRLLQTGAIAGINASNAAEVIAAGANGIAIVSAAISGSNVLHTCRQLRIIVDNALKNKQDF